MACGPWPWPARAPGTWPAHALGEARHWGGSNGVREAAAVPGVPCSPGPAEAAIAWRRLIAQAMDRDGDAAAHAARGTAPAPGGGRHAQLDPGMERACARLRSWRPGPLRNCAGRWPTARPMSSRAPAAAGARAPGGRCTGARSCGPPAPPAPTPGAWPPSWTARGPPCSSGCSGWWRPSRDHLAARRERFDLLLRRMPDPRLEPILAQDAARALVTLEFAPSASWKPDPNLWADAAQTGPAPAWSRPSAPGPTAPTCGGPGSAGPGSTPPHPSVLALAQGTVLLEPPGRLAGLPARTRCSGRWPRNCAARATSRPCATGSRASGSTWTTAP